MSVDLQPLGRALVLFGVILALLGLLLLAGPKIPWLGRLPGDLVIQRERFAFYFPLASSLLVSLILSLILWLFSRR